MTTTTVHELRTPAPREASMPAVTMGFGSLQSFELMQRAANLLASSTLVPAAYRKVIEKLDRYGNVTESRDNPNALANAVVALNMAQRMGADPLMVMQNLYIVEGRPSWSSQWIIAAVNGCGRFSPLRFDIKSLGEKTVERVETYWENKQRMQRTVQVKIVDKVCVAWAIEKETKERIESPAVSIEMAVKEGWYTKTGSKWQTMEEVMLRYRTASFFGKLYAPELLMGLQSVEEAQDIIDVQPDGSFTVTRTVDDLRNTPAPAAEVVAADTPASTPAPAPAPAPAEVQSQPKDDTGSSSAHGEPAGETFEDVKRDLMEAKTLEDLDFARSLIKQVHSEEHKAELNQIAAQRMRDIAPPQDAPAQTTTATRRTRTPVGAD